MPTDNFASAAAPRDRVYRVGFEPEPWAWPGWEWATNGRFNGRWDDGAGNFRTVYAGDSLFACLLEVLAAFRVDPELAAALALVEVEAVDQVPYPTAPAGHVPHSWLEHRIAFSAVLRGTYCDVASAASIATLRPRFIADALRLGRRDFDAAALKDSGCGSSPRP